MSAAAVATFPHERVELRTARIEHQCWSWTERCKAPGDGYDGEPTCTRVIGVGEQYVHATVYPGHDSGYADGRQKRVDGGWVPAPPAPLASKFCLPCARRWANLKRGLEQIESRTDG